MRISDCRVWVGRGVIALAVIAGAAVLSSATKKTVFTPRDKAYYADQNTISFVRPGLTMKIVSTKIAADGTVTVDYKLTDPKGLGLDRLGIQTPGSVAVSFLLTYIAKGDTQYTSYITRQRTSTDGKNTVTQATGENNGTQTQIAEGEYLYTFSNKVPKTFDATASHRVGIYGSRNLSEFDLGTNYDDDILDFVPAGGTPAPREVIKTESCNKCHDSLGFHGGSRRSLGLCIMCHQPQTKEPNGNQTVDMKVMTHKIHMGEELPSVKAGGKYAIGSTDWSTVALPSDPRRCAECHDASNKPLQPEAWNTNPSRAACGSCHDDVNFATGQNHLNLPQVDDKQCAGCHIPQGELELDASIKGAHVVPEESATAPGIVINLLKVDNGGAGKFPTINFTLKDKAGKPIDPASLAVTPNKISFVMTGPTTDYGAAVFTGVTSPGYVSENAPTTAKCGQDGTCTYTFTHNVPASATGTFAIGVEARRALVVLPGTVKEVSTRYGVDNKVIYFSVDGSPVVKRRQIVDTAKCNQCHVRLSLHGENRNNTEYCVFCHNPNLVAGSGTAAVPVNFSYMVHSIHFGENMTADGGSYKIGSTEFAEVRYPAMTAGGRPGDTTNCAMCHVNGSEGVFPVGLLAVKTPNRLSDVTPATVAACSACHITRSAMAHMSAQTDPKYGESCSSCHDVSGQFSVQKEHAK
ncbi:MAG: OmcA/MtrC family decaheme c-type cytochrome [Candidatus Solibacter sp.]